MISVLLLSNQNQYQQYLQLKLIFNEANLPTVKQGMGTQSQAREQIVMF